MSTPALALPWYRQFWPWVLIFLPLSAVVGCLITIALALRDPDGLVVDDYYQEGLTINQRLDRARIARERGIGAVLELDRDHHRLSLELAAPERPERLELALLHATRAGQDHHISLRRVGENLYQSALPVLSPGRWHVQLDGADWRVTGSLKLSGGGSGNNRLNLDAR